MAKTKEATPGIGNGEILAEIKLIDLIQRIETKLVIQPNTIRFAELADAYIGIGNYDEAIRLCTEGLAHYPHYGPAHLVLARAHYRSGNKAKAREILESYLNVSPANSSAHKLLGDIALEGDDIRSAVNRYRTALRMDPINRDVIQQLVDLKDAYQKVKDGAEDDEPADARPLVIEKPPAPSTLTEKKKEAPTTTTETGKKPTATKDTEKVSEADLLIRHDLVDLAAKSKKSADVVDETPIETKAPPKKIPEKKEEPAPVVTPSKSTEPPAVKPAASADELGGLIPSYTDAQGKYYFCVDDELSFPEYKKRKALIDAGKAVLMSRAELDDLISRAAPVKKPRDVAKEEVPPPKAKIEKPAVDETAEPADAETLLSLDEQEAALDELEISYKDYLDILTDEALLMEALFTEEEPYGGLEDQDLSLVSKLAGESPDTPMSYHDYVASLTDASDRHEAKFADDEKAMSLAEYSASLDDEPIDFRTFLMTSPEAAAIEASLQPVDSEPELTYAEYLASVPDTLKKEASFEAPVSSPAIQEVEKPVAPSKPVVKPPEPTVEVPKPKVTPAPSVKPAAVETVEVEEEEEIVEETEEIETTEINPNDATPELVDTYIAAGQFGTAYKVCKILKQKSPTDAKVDRKMLELKRLYLWSTQLAG